MRRFSPFLLVIAMMLSAAAIMACAPANSPGVAEPTQTTGPDYSGPALATYSAGTATAAASEATEPTPIVTGQPVGSAITEPIKATFFPQRQATEYTIELSSPIDDITWNIPSCGQSNVDAGGAKMTWIHAHPPCDETTSHDDETIEAGFRAPTHEGTRWVTCIYQGSSTGTGEPCVWS